MLVRIRAQNTSGWICTSDKMSLRYHNKVVIVTGGSKGIGRGIVKAFGMEIITIVSFNISAVGCEPLAFFSSGEWGQGCVLCTRRSVIQISSDFCLFFVLKHFFNLTLNCIPGAAGEALEAELNRAGPGSCTFVRCDVSREDDIKVKVTQLVVRCGVTV